MFKFSHFFNIVKFFFALCQLTKSIFPVAITNKCIPLIILFKPHRHPVLQNNKFTTAEPPF